MRKMNKKANWVDNFEYAGGILVIGIALFFTLYFLNTFDASVNNVTTDASAIGYSASIVQSFSTTDYILPLIYIFFIGFTAWSASKVPSSHIFTFLAIIMLVILFIFAMMIESAWQEFTSQALMSGLISSFPITNFMISQAKYFVLFYGFITGIFLYAKRE